MFVSLWKANAGGGWSPLLTTGAHGDRVKEKIDFIFFKIVLNLKLELIDFTDLLPSPNSGCGGVGPLSRYYTYVYIL